MNFNYKLTICLTLFVTSEGLIGQENYQNDNPIFMKQVERILPKAFLKKLEKDNDPSKPIKLCTVSLPLTINLYFKPSPNKKKISKVKEDFRLHQPPKGLKDILDVLTATPSGETTVNSFLTQYWSGEILVEEMTEVMKSEYQKQNRQVGAVYIYDTVAKVRRIYVDYKMELGLLAPLFLAEVEKSFDENCKQFHSSQEQAWNTYEKKRDQIFDETAERLDKEILDLKPNDFTPEDAETLNRLERSLFFSDSVCHYSTQTYEARASFINEFQKRHSCYSDYLKTRSDQFAVLYY